MHLIIADHTLINFQGHSFEYCQSVRNAALAKGWKATVLATKKVAHEVQRDINAVPFFCHDFFHAFPLPFWTRAFSEGFQRQFFSWWNFRGHNRSLFRDLLQIAPECSNSEPVLLLFPTFSFNDMVPIIRFAEALPEASKTRVAMVQHFTSQHELFQPWREHRFYKRGFSRLGLSKAKDRILLFADCEELIEEYSQYSNHPMGLLPIPHVSCQMAQEPELPPDKPITIGYLGDARQNKGFHLLPEAINFVMQNWKGKPIQWEIQANVRNAPEWEVYQAVRLLEKIPNMRLYKEAMPTAEYQGLMKRIDLFLLPYQTSRYHRQTSGVFGEIRALGKPTVVSRGTWSARKIKANGGGVLFLPEDPKSLGDAILQSLNNFETLSAQAKSAAPQWATFHNPGNYLDCLNKSFIEN